MIIVEKKTDKILESLPSQNIDDDAYIKSVQMMNKQMTSVRRDNIIKSVRSGWGAEKCHVRLEI